MAKKSGICNERIVINPFMSLSIDIIMMFLALIGIFIILRELFTPMTAEEHVLLIGLDTLICVVFIVEYMVRSYCSGSWREYFRGHWYDLLGSIPIPMIVTTPLRLLRWFRLLRLFTIFFRLRQAFRMAKVIKASNVLAYTVIVAASIIMLCAMLLYWIESPANQDIQSFFDSLWWAVITVTTVGYGDTVPLTSAERIVAMTLMIAGIGIIGSLAASIASLIIGSGSKEDGDARENTDVASQLERLSLLRDANKLSAREFEQAKSRLLSGTGNSGTAKRKK